MSATKERKPIWRCTIGHMSAVGSSSPSPQGTSPRSHVDGVLESSSQGITKGRIHPPPPTPNGDRFSCASQGLQGPMQVSLEAAPWLHKRCPCNWGRSRRPNTVLQLVATARLKLLIQHRKGVSEAGHKKFQICHSIYHSRGILLYIWNSSSMKCSTHAKHLESRCWREESVVWCQVPSITNAFIFLNNT